MSEMVERVALAICEKLRNIGYGVGTINASQLADFIAPVAIEAMRVPTDDMVYAAITSGCTCNTIEGYHAMIDEALK